MFRGSIYILQRFIKLILSYGLVCLMKLRKYQKTRRPPCGVRRATREFLTRDGERKKKNDSRASACADVLHLPCFKGECTGRISVCKASGGARSFIILLYETLISDEHT